MGSEPELSHEILLNSQEEAIKLLGENGELRKHIQNETRASIVDRGATVVIKGETRQVAQAHALLVDLLAAVRRGHTPTRHDVDAGLDQMRHGGVPASVLGEKSPVLRSELHVRPRTAGQIRYLDAIEAFELTLAIGPAGTGKTYLAMAAAVSALLSKRVKRLILTRPAVEAGESLGFLPGDLEQKVNPYLRPLYDALYSMVDIDRVQRFIDHQQIEVAPLAFMRGRSLDQSFIILDEAQNTTTDQMLMFLTRLGQGSRAIVTGDITQNDLPKGIPSGLIQAERILHGVPGIGIIHLDRSDVVRNPLVQRIINAYDSHKRRIEESGEKDAAMDARK